jgi:two-component system, NtrC family, response regulator AtoC
MAATILIVDDEKHTREGLQQALENDYEIYLAANADQAFNLLESDSFDVILTDLKMAGKSGMKVLDKALSMPYHPITIMMTAYGSVETAVEAMKHGAHDFLTKPVNLKKLEILIKRFLKARDLENENKALHSRLDQKYSFKGIVGNSTALQNVIEKVELVAPSKATVLLQGETGTGKELIAQAIHQNSDRVRNPFIAVHCAALPANLLESELFGHEKGAFTGATERRIGRFESANGGTLFLDEIGEIDSSTQIKLLRFLESRTLERLGSVTPLKIDIRLIVATNRDLEEMVKKGEFREDLYYRLHVVDINLPPLRQRKDDIIVLLDHFIQEFSKENAKEPLTLSAGAKQAIQKYNWPGNIRELRNFAENMVVMNKGMVITEYDLDPKFLDLQEHPTSKNDSLNNPLSVQENEKCLLHDALIKTRGNRTKAAQILGISRRTLHRKLIQWPELDSPEDNTQ